MSVLHCEDVSLLCLNSQIVNTRIVIQLLFQKNLIIIILYE